MNRADLSSDLALLIKAEQSRKIRLFKKHEKSYFFGNVLKLPADFENE